MIETMKKKEYDDDGRRIADMSGIDRPNLFGGYRRHKASKPDEASCKADCQESSLSRDETRAVLINALLAALVVAGIFLFLGAAFILFCTQIWFR